MTFKPMTRNPAETIEAQNTNRIIGSIKGREKGPTLIFFGGIHGNEPSGVQILEEVFGELEGLKDKINGRVIGIKGNIPALAKERRFLENDLNRIWTESSVREVNSKSNGDRNSEEVEMAELYDIISNIIKTETPPFYFIDYHTTSSPTLPFITINDAMINRKFARQFPLPVILGLEEYLEGPLLSYINEKGYVAVGFESGQHFTEEAVSNGVAFTWLTLTFAGILSPDLVPISEHKEKLIRSAKGNNNFYEVIYRHLITSEDDFKMAQGFNSFDDLNEGTELASHNGKKISTEKDTIIFMPLYQEQGEEGFFLIRKIPQWILKLSAFMRRLRLDNLLTLLPGVSWASPSKERLMVNLRVARYLSKPLFHLLGYRSRFVDETHILMNNRERPARTEMYRNTAWYRK